ncbi:MAG: ATP-binding protein [Bacteriovoracaceae bacterium]|nr:ATP-binding protein [Bacteriovoracaceae bacterium]
MFDPFEIERLIKVELPDCKVEALDQTGGGDHFAVNVKSNAFKGKSMLEQHRMIYKALGDAMSGPIHALTIHTEVL